MALATYSNQLINSQYVQCVQCVQCVLTLPALDLHTTRL